MNWWRLYIVCRLRNYLRWNLNQSTTVLLQEIAFRNDLFHGNPCSFRLGPIRTISVIVSNHNGTRRDYTKWFWFHFAYRSRWIKNTTLGTVVQLKRKNRFIDEIFITGYQNMNLSNQGWNIVEIATFLFDSNVAFFFLKPGPWTFFFAYFRSCVPWCSNLTFWTACGPFGSEGNTGRDNMSTMVSGLYQTLLLFMPERVNLSALKPGYSEHSLNNTTVTDALAPCVARASVTMVLSVWDREVIVL